MDKEVKLTLGLAELPKWLRLLPMGQVNLVDGRPPFEVDPESLAELVQAFDARGTDLVIDYEHQSLKGGQAPAAGWIKDLEVREDGLWAQVEWTGQAEEYIRRREYRYFSPVLRLDPETRRPRELMNVALTNTPAIRGLTPLVAKWGGEGQTTASLSGLMEKPGGDFHLDADGETAALLAELKARLGVQGETPGTDLLRKMVEFFRELSGNLGLPPEANLSQLRGGLEALKAGEEQMGSLQTELAALKTQLKEENALRKVEEAMMAGKISPAQKDWALSYCRRDPESFKIYVDKAPRVVPVGVRLNLGEERGRKHQGLTPEELAVCRAMNLAPEAYLQAKARIGQAKKGGGDAQWQH
ncbi:MAG: phage protease [Desulfobaccales bacterium]